MATYSTNLALTLLATGEGAGTWGNTTNTNLGTLLEQAISGYATESLTTGTTLTLTIPNGSTGVARNMYLEFTGNGSTVIVPSNKKLYFVYNNCTSGTITMKVAGQTGVTIEKGSKQILVSNGTDVATAITSLNGITNSTVTALGTNAGDSITSGVQNTAIGYDAGTAITTGGYNTVVGYNAGKAISTSLFNTCVGNSAGVVMSTAELNTAIGYAALASNTTGSGYNTAVGGSALGNMTTGNTCTAIGAGAGSGLTSNKIASSFLGWDAGYTGNYSGITCVGANTSCSGNNQVQLGDSTTTTYAYGAVQDRSDLRDKTDIQDTQLGLDFIMALRPRDFKWDMREDYRPEPPPANATPEEWAAYNETCKLSNITHDGTHKRSRYHHGLIAQEVKQTMDAMGVDFGGYQDHTIKGGDAVLTIGYEELVAPLIKAIQELKAEFDAYKSTHP
jgi:hypothetical protein